MRQSLSHLATLAPSTRMLCTLAGRTWYTTDRAVAVSCVLRGGNVWLASF